MLKRIILPRHILIALAVLTIFIQAYRVPVNVMAPGLDQSYPHILNLFAFTSMQFGSDIVYTFGPLGFLLAIENVHNNLVLGFAFWSILYLILSIAIVYLVVSLTSGWRLITSFILAVFVAPYIDAERLIPCLVMLLLLIAYEEQQHREKILALCGGLAAIGLLIKFPLGIACAGMAMGSAILPIKFRMIIRNLLVVVLSMTLSFSLLWFLTGGLLERIPDYFLNSFQLTSGYTADMSSARLNEDASLISFIAAIGILVTMMALLPHNRRGHAFLVMLFPIFIAWKHGVVRFDGHILDLLSVAMFSAFLLLVLHLHGADTKNTKINRFNIPGLAFSTRAIVAIGLFLAVAVLLNEGLVLSGMAYNRYPLVSNGFLESAGRGWVPGLIPIKNVFRFGRYKENLDALASANLAGHRLDKSILKLIGGRSVDIYSYELGFVAANPELNYHPKPIFQHFNAFTDKLDQLNANFFVSSKRPKFLIMHHPNGSMAGVDGRYQLYDDPIAFLQIMNLYKPVFVEKDPLKPQVALLEYSASNKSRFLPPVAFKNEVTQWNKTVILPTGKDSSILRVKINLHKPIISSIKEAVFRLSPMYLVYILSDGTQQKYRLVPTHLSSGVWISPLFVDYWNFYDFLSGTPWMGPKVVAIRFEADNPQDYADSFTLVWERIECKTGYCNPVESRIFNSSSDNLKRVPIPITTSVLASFISPVDSVAAIDVFLSTYAKINKGTLILSLVDNNGMVLRESTVDAAIISDNAYQRFVFDPVSNIKGQKVWLRLAYMPNEHGQVAAWRTAVTKPDFDFRVYGH